MNKEPSLCFYLPYFRSLCHGHQSPFEALHNVWGMFFIDIRVPLMWNEEEHFRAKEGGSGKMWFSTFSEYCTCNMFMIQNICTYLLQYIIRFEQGAVLGILL